MTLNFRSSYGLVLNYQTMTLIFMGVIYQVSEFIELKASGGFLET